MRQHVHRRKKYKHGSLAGGIPQVKGSNGPWGWPVVRQKQYQPPGSASLSPRSPHSRRFRAPRCGWGGAAATPHEGIFMGPDHTQRLRALTRVGLAVVLRDARRHRFAATACPPPPLRPAAAAAAAACSSYRRCYTAAPATVIVAANTAQHNTSHCTKLHDTRTNRRAID